MNNIRELSKTPFKTLKNKNLADTESASLLLQAGFIRQEVAGVFHYLPLGVRVLNKIKAIIAKHLEDFGAEEIYMSGIGSKEHREQTGRQDMDVLYTLPSGEGKYNFLNPTHEEIVTPLMKEFIQSYKDLPCIVYQTQTKFRNEKRPKSGILRGREFLMNDTYSFHRTTEDLENTYTKMIQVYKNIFADLGLGETTFLTYASGGTYSKYSHEFQTLTNSGEDLIYVDAEKGIAVNKEVLDTEEGKQEFENYNFIEHKASEVGNIFQLGTKFTNACDAHYLDENGQLGEIIMGCYGIGVSRTMGIIADKFFDEKGLVRPDSVAPYDYYFIILGGEELEDEKNTIIKKLIAAGKSIIIDDRDTSFGKKAQDADLLGIPNRIILSQKSKENGGIEFKRRTEAQSRILADIQEIL